MQFLVLYLAPADVIEAFGKIPPDQRKPAEDKMRNAWGNWMAGHASMITDIKAAGATKRASANGISDIKNDIMLYSILDAESHEAAAEVFKDHPHLEIPQASIEIMPIRPLSGH